MRLPALFSFIFLYTHTLFAAEGIYSIATIAPQLKEKAHAIVRIHETTFTVKTINEATKKVRYAITIMDEKAKDHATLHVGYDKLIQVNYIKGVLYDALGNPVSKLKKSEIQDVSSISDFSLFEDDRMKVAAFTRVQYPYTVEFEYEITSKNLLFYPRWVPQYSLNLAIEKATFTVVMPNNLALRHMQVNLSAPVKMSPVSDTKTYFWEISNLPAKEREAFSPGLAALVPVVYTAPTEFEVEGYKGDMSTWEGLGKWHHQLNAGRDELPEELKNRIKQLTANESDPYKKAKKVYEYLQGNTRYVSIQLGIGGWQPFEAKVVANKGYGDCKALSNYTQAMLKAVGIESFYASIKAGDDEPDILTDFPSSQFNHVVLCVPFPKDTLWLECTSQTNAFGYMGSFTGDRHALAITPTGGKLIKTPVYKSGDNLQNRKAEVFIDLQCDAMATIQNVYTGLQQEDISQVMHAYGLEDQKKWLYKQIKIPSFEITKFAFTQQKERIPVVTESISLAIRKCASKSGTRIFLTPNLLSAWTHVPQQTENRQTDVVIRSGFIDTDTITYHLPEGYQVEYLPEQVSIDSKFGSYKASVKEDNGKLVYTRKVTMDKKTLPNSTYPELVDFLKKVVKADKMQVVLVAKP